MSPRARAARLHLRCGGSGSRSGEYAQRLRKQARPPGCRIAKNTAEKTDILSPFESVFAALITNSRNPSLIPLIASIASINKLRITCCSCTRSPRISGADFDTYKDRFSPASIAYLMPLVIAALQSASVCNWLRSMRISIRFSRNPANQTKSHQAMWRGPASTELASGFKSGMRTRDLRWTLGKIKSSNRKEGQVCRTMREKCLRKGRSS